MAERKAWSLDDIYQMRWLHSVALSADGSRAAFVVRSFVRGQSEFVQKLWSVGLDGSHLAHQLTRGSGADLSPKWSPDGRYLAFLSSRSDDLEWENAGSPLDSEAHASPPEHKAQIWMLDVSIGGEACQLTHQEEGIEAFDWAPDSRGVVFAARTPSNEERQYLKGIRDKKDPRPWVLTRVQHKYDGQGYLDNVLTHLYRLDVPSRAVVPLTAGPASETHPQWSPDGQWIGFLSNRTGDPDQNQRTDLYLIRPDGSETRRMTQGDLRVETFAFAPDRQRLWLLASPSPENAYIFNRLYEMDMDQGLFASAFPDDIGRGYLSVGGIIADEIQGQDPVAHARVYPKPTGSTPVRLLSPELPGPLYGPLIAGPDQTIVLRADAYGQTRLMAVDPRGTYTWLAPKDPLATITSAAGNATALVAVLNGPTVGSELHRCSPSGDLVALTAMMAPLTQSRDLAEVSWKRFKGSDGQKLAALVTIPPGYAPGDSPLPLIVAIHGGPMAFDAPELDFDTQYWAGLGYAVLQVNYRGSTSYGQEFSQCIQGRWGPLEHSDLMAGVDLLIRERLADPNRLYCTGFSQGGVMTNWAVGHTDRFQAAASEHGLWDYVSAFGTDDCHAWWQDDLGVPWQNWTGYFRMSPMSAVTAIRTPLLIMAGQNDWRCPLSQAEEMYLALKKRGVATELVIYPNEHHAISGPERAMDRLLRIADWFYRYGGLPVAPKS